MTVEFVEHKSVRDIFTVHFVVSHFLSFCIISLWWLVFRNRTGHLFKSEERFNGDHKKEKEHWLHWSAH